MARMMVLYDFQRVKVSRERVFRMFRGRIMWSEDLKTALRGCFISIYTENNGYSTSRRTIPAQFAALEVIRSGI